MVTVVHGRRMLARAASEIERAFLLLLCRARDSVGVDHGGLNVAVAQ